MKKTVTILLLGVIAASTLFGCAGKEDPANNAVPSAGSGARPDPTTGKKAGSGPGAASPSTELAHP